MIFNSKEEGENEQKLIDAYTGKNNIIFLVKTVEDGRFGGYVSQSFEKNLFEKSDKNAFLFNLDEKKIFKSKGLRTIWRSEYATDSINFGGGADLKISHTFLSKQGSIFPDNDFDYNNGNLYKDEDFNVAFLEIYQVI